MIVFEIVLGVMLLLGSMPKITVWLFLLLVLFFTFLTGFRNKPMLKLKSRSPSIKSTIKILKIYYRKIMDSLISWKILSEGFSLMGYKKSLLKNAHRLSKLLSVVFKEGQWMQQNQIRCQVVPMLFYSLQSVDIIVQLEKKLKFFNQNFSWLT